MTDALELPVNDRIAQHVRTLRSARGLSLEAMAARCDVSRSMLSLIERGESSPTAVVLEKIATGLRVPFASLFEAPTLDDPIARRDSQPVWTDPQSGYVRRTVSPSGSGSPIQIVEVSFPPGAHVAYETGAREPRIHQQVWVLEGEIEVTLGRRDPSAGRGRLPRHAARPTDRIPQHHTEGRALRRHRRVRADREAMTMSAHDTISVRRLHAVSEQEIAGLADVLIDCVEGGASISFMRPLSRAKALAFWQDVAERVDRGATRAPGRRGRGRHRRHGAARAGAAREPAAPRRARQDDRPPPRTAPRHRRRCSCGRPRRSPSSAGGRSWCSTPRAPTPSACTSGRAGSASATVPDYALLPDGGRCDTVFFYRQLES